MNIAKVERVNHLNDKVQGSNNVRVTDGRNVISSTQGYIDEVYDKIKKEKVHFA